jgi:Domain of unknown function (DUF5667)
VSRRFRGETPPPEMFGGLDPDLLDALAGLGDLQRETGRRAAGRAAVMVAAARAREASVTGRWRTGWRRRVAIAAFGVTGVNLALGGVVALAAGALPDSPLYGLKRAAETVRLSLAFDAVDKAHLELDLAERRVDEAVAMAGSGHDQLALDAARDATTLVEEAGATLTANPSVDNEQALAHASDQALTRLEAVFAALENGADPGAAEAARSLDDTWSRGLDNAESGDTGKGAAGGHGGDAGAAGSGGTHGSPSANPGVGAGADHAGGTDHPGGREGH